MAWKIVSSKIPPTPPFSKGGRNLQEQHFLTNFTHSMTRIAQILNRPAMLG